MNDIQITVEVRFITLQDNFFEQMGMDFDVNFRNSKGNMYASLNNGDDTTTTTNSTTSDSSTSINSASYTSAVKNSNLIAGLLPGGSTASPNFANGLGIGIDQNSMGFAVPEFGGYQSGAGASVGFAILSDIESYLFITAAQGDKRNNVLQAPKVTTINGQTASIRDMTSKNLVVGVIPVVGDYSVAQQPVVQAYEDGVELSVTPVVSSDRRYVRMNLYPYFSTVDFSAVETYTFDSSNTSSTTVSTGGNANTNTSSSGTSTQSVPVREFSFDSGIAVSVPDGGTLLLGGIKRLSEGRKEAGIPMINKIPYLKRLFTNTAVGRTSETMMMMVTPHIIIQEEYEESMASAVSNQ